MLGGPGWAKLGRLGRGRSGGRLCFRLCFRSVGPAVGHTLQWACIAFATQIVSYVLETTTDSSRCRRAAPRRWHAGIGDISMKLTKPGTDTICEPGTDTICASGQQGNLISLRGTDTICARVSTGTHLLASRAHCESATTHKALRSPGHHSRASQTAYADVHMEAVRQCCLFCTYSTRSHRGIFTMVPS